MIVFRENDDFEPLAWASGYPVYATTLLVAAHVLALVAVWLAMAFGSGLEAGWLAFSSTEVLRHGALWQWFTYVWVHSGASPLFFAIEMFLLYAFGREVEKYIGRRKFLLLYAVLVVAPPALLTFLGLVFPTELRGSGDVHFAVFIAFATLYPGVEFFLRIPARWLAWAAVLLYGLYFLASHQWASFLAFMIDAAAASLFIAWVRGVLPSPRLFGWARQLKRPAQSKKPREKPAPPQDDPMAAIDPLLDKIARDGLASLSQEELDALEKARQALLGKPKR